MYYRAILEAMKRGGKSTALFCAGYGAAAGGYKKAVAIQLSKPGAIEGAQNQTLFALNDSNMTTQDHCETGNAAIKGALLGAGLGFFAGAAAGGIGGGVAVAARAIASKMG